MSDIQSISDKMSYVFAKVARKMQDVNIASLGTKCQVLRIAPGTPDSWGQSVDDLKDMLIDNVYIKHPFSSKIQLFQKANEATQNVESAAFDMYEFLPIEVRHVLSGDYEEDAIELLRGDMLVSIFYDQHKKPIPIILQIQRSYGEFAVRHLCGITYEATLYRGTPQDNIQNAIQLYIDSLAEEK